MKCPFCHEESDKVVDSRSIREGAAVRRRRECQNCNKRFTTYEYIETAPLTVVKKDDSREPFDRSKLIRGLKLCTIKRPVSTKQIEELVDDIENELFKPSRSEISSTAIGELIIVRLRKIDEVAYVRFASVYRDFKDKDEFLKELNDLQKPGTTDGE